MPLRDPMNLPASSYRRHVDLVALELYLAGERRSAITNPSIRNPLDRKKYRALARRAIDFSRDVWPEAVCAVCGCTDAVACPEGCSWIVVNRMIGLGVCSQCVKEPR